MRHLQYDPETNRLSDDEGTPYVEIDPDQWMSKGDKQEIANAIIGHDRIQEQVRILREALEGATSDIEDTLSELKLMNPKRQNHNEEARIQRFRAVLEATKEGA